MPAEFYHANTVEEYFGHDCYCFVDTAISSWHERFNQQGIEELLQCETCLISGIILDDLQRYPEFDLCSLKTELALFLKIIINLI